MKAKETSDSVKRRDIFFWKVCSGFHGPYIVWLLLQDINISEEIVNLSRNLKEKNDPISCAICSMSILERFVQIFERYLQLLRGWAFQNQPSVKCDGADHNELSSKLPICQIFIFFLYIWSTAWWSLSTAIFLAALAALYLPLVITSDF